MRLLFHNIFKDVRLELKYRLKVFKEKGGRILDLNKYKTIDYSTI
jgi:hypothetical protein